METIHKVQEKYFWQAGSIPAIERVRVELRDLLKFLDAENTVIYYTAFEDEIGDKAHDVPVIYNANDLTAYRQKVEQYLKENSTHITIYKLRNNIPITHSELEELEKMLFMQGNLGTKDEFVKAYGDQPLGKFIRRIIGLDANAAKLAFGEILKSKTLNSQQIRFIDTIINFFVVNGSVDPAVLFEPPFTDINSSGIAGLFDDETQVKLIQLIEKVNDNAVA
jgi:type I restriction enzyme R subunit